MTPDLKPPMRPLVRNALAAAVAIAAIAFGAYVPLPTDAPAPVTPPPPAAPQAPTVTLHVDTANNAVCWVASSNHGVGISCLSSGPGEFGP